MIVTACGPTQTGPLRSSATFASSSSAVAPSATAASAGVATPGPYAGGGAGRSAADELAEQPGVQRSSDSMLVLVSTTDAATTEVIRAAAQGAVADVDRLWGPSWPKPVTVVAPKDLAELAAVLHRTEAQVADTAAWTLGPREPSARATADQVVLNPQLWSQTGTVGRSVILRHEFVHVAVRATTTRDGPLWLSEGYAQYVALHGLDLSPRILAGAYLERIRRDGPPKELPADADFAAQGVRRDDAYTASWLAVRELALARGESALKKAVRAGAVAPSEWSTEVLTDRWRSAVETLASQ